MDKTNHAHTASQYRSNALLFVLLKNANLQGAAVGQACHIRWKLAPTAVHGPQKMEQH